MSGTSRTKVTPTSSTSTSATCGTRSIVRSDAIRSRPCAVPATGSALSRADALADAGDAGLGGPDGRRPGRDRRLRLPAVTDRAPANRRRDPAVEGACRASGRGGDGFAQLIGPEGSAIESSSSIAGASALVPGDLRGPTYSEREAVRIEGEVVPARILANPVPDGGVLVVGAPLDDQRTTLGRLAAAL